MVSAPPPGADVAERREAESLSPSAIAEAEDTEATEALASSISMMRIEEPSETPIPSPCWTHARHSQPKRSHPRCVHLCLACISLPLPFPLPDSVP